MTDPLEKEDEMKATPVFVAYVRRGDLPTAEAASFATVAEADAFKHMMRARHFDVTVVTADPRRLQPCGYCRRCAVHDDPGGCTTVEAYEMEIGVRQGFEMPGGAS